MDGPSVLGAFLHDVGHLVGLVNKMEVMFASDGKALGTKRLHLCAQVLNWLELQLKGNPFFVVLNLDRNWEQWIVWT